MTFIQRIGRIVLAVLAVLSLALPGVAQTVEYYHLDALGSVRAITDQTGAVIERHDYLPFGEEFNPPPSTDPRKFTGKERDIARFTTTDPVFTLSENLTDPQRWNRYAYVRNNPLRHIDPDGRCLDACVMEGYALYAAAAASVATVAYLESPQGQRAMRDFVEGTGQMITTAVSGIQSWFQSDKKPGTLGKPDHQATAAEEAARIGGTREVVIQTPGGKKDSRRADAAVVDPATGKITGEIIQVYRPTPRGNIPQREKDAAADVGKATGTEPTMLPVRPILPKPE